jgi:hypothetical protein
MGERIVRPSMYDCHRDFHLAVQTFGLEGTARARARAHMRQSIRGIVACLHERDRVHDAVGLSRLEPESVAVCDALFDKEAFFRDEYSHETPNILAGRMVNLCADGDLEAKAEGNGHCATMAMGLLALKGLRPNLSGLIGEHVAFFYANPRAAFARNAFSLRTNRAQDPRAPFVAAFIHELVSEGRHHHLGGLVLTNNRRIDFRAGLEISGRRAAMILKGRCYRP